MRPYAPSGVPADARPASGTTREMPSAWRFGTRSGRCSRDVAEGVAALVAVERRVGKRADTEAVDDDHDHAPER